MAFNPMPSSIRVARALGHLPKVPTRIGRAEGGLIPDSPDKPFSGPIVSPVAGRTDHVPMHVPNQSYVVPADVVSAIGEGNSISGLGLLGSMFPAKPYGANGGPFGSAMPSAKPGRPNFPKAPPLPPYAGGAPKFPYAAGGLVHEATPINAAGGEFVIHPEDVAKVGGGDIRKGHKVLDHWVKSVRARTIKELKGLPGPAR